jgi:hypothetical protein
LAKLPSIEADLVRRVYKELNKAYEMSKYFFFDEGAHPRHGVIFDRNL